MACSAPPLLEWRELESRLQGRCPALFLDYDGTLTPIVDRPEHAMLAPHVRALLRRLATLCPLALVSGRDRAQLESLVGLEGPAYVGSHGFDIRGPAGSGIVHEVAHAALPAVAAAERELRARLCAIDGAQVERKRFSVAAHFRRVRPEHVAQVERAVGEVLALHPELARKEGKMVFELLPGVDWSKGKAVLWLLEALHLDGPGTLPLHFGDDLTDETVFEALRGRGLGILVEDAPRPSAAAWRVHDPAEVARLLEHLANWLAAR